jgi:hypothetical protein
MRRHSDEARNRTPAARDRGAARRRRSHDHAVNPDHTHSARPSPAAASSARTARGDARPGLHGLPARRADRGSASPGSARIVLAVDPHVEEDRAAGDGCDDDRGRARHPDGHPAEPDEDGQAERPEERRHAVREGGEAHPLSILEAPKNSPSRWRFRPPNPLAFRLRVQPPGPASVYSRSVLGASGTLRRRRTADKGVGTRKGCSLHLFRFDPCEQAIRAVCSRHRDQKNSPSRLRFCPPNRLTFRFRVWPPDSASIYSRSVLGAGENLDVPATALQDPRAEKKSAVCESSYERSRLSSAPVTVTPGWGPPPITITRRPNATTPSPCRGVGRSGSRLQTPLSASRA